MSNSKLKIKYGMIEFEIESDPQTIEKERKAFMETLPNIALMARPQIHDSEEINSLQIEETKSLPLNNKSISSNINTFMNDKGFGSDIDKCLGVIYFMNIVENIELIDTSLVKERMQKAKLSIPKSISVAFNSLTTKGHIQPVEQEEKGLTKYYITDEGKRFVEEYVKKETKSKNAVKKVRNVKKSIETNYSFLTKEMMNLEKYPDFYKLKNSKEKIMLIMYIIKDIDKGEYFTINDLKYIISNIFNDKLTDDAIKGVFKNKSTAKYFDKRNVENNNKVYEYKMIQSGFSYFEENIINNNI